MMKLKTHLIVLVVGAVLPIMVFAIILAGLFTRQREQVVASGMLETARALTLAVDAELYSSASTLEAMAVSGHLSSGDLATFYKQCGRIRPTQRGWLSIYLLDANGASSSTCRDRSEKFCPIRTTRSSIARSSAAAGRPSSAISWIPSRASPPSTWAFRYGATAT